MQKSVVRRLVVVAGLLLSASTALAAWAPLKLDMVHSRIGFTASTLLFDVDGEFKKFDVTVDGDPSKPAAAKIKVEIDASSIDTDNAKRDGHLRNPDFLDVDKFPKITFESTSIKETAKGLSVTGTLSLHGKTKSLTIPFKVARGKNGAGMDSVAYKGKLTLDRTAFGVGTDSVAAKISLEDELEIELLLVTLK